MQMNPRNEDKAFLLKLLSSDKSVICERRQSKVQRRSANSGAAGPIVSASWMELLYHVGPRKAANSGESQPGRDTSDKGIALPGACVRNVFFNGKSVGQYPFKMSWRATSRLA